MVGKRAQASILILKDSTEEIKNLTQEYVSLGRPLPLPLNS